MPFYKVPLASTKWIDSNGTPTPEFFRFINNLFIAAGGGGPPQSISPTGSPFVYIANAMGYPIVKGGTVSKIEFSRDAGTTWFDLGVTAGMFTMENQDELRVTYTVAPTMTFIPA